MNEEEAVFQLGKHFSYLRNHGEDLPSDSVPVGNSMVLPQELADEYDKHNPPPPPTPKKVTNRIFNYELTYLGEVRMGCPAYGLSISYGSQNWLTFANTILYTAAHRHHPLDNLKHSKCNRYDVIPFYDFTLVIDKVKEAVSLLKARFRIDNTTFSEETPIWKSESTYIEEKDGYPIGATQYPFVPIDEFWVEWDKYVDLRREQIEQNRLA